MSFKVNITKRNTKPNCEWFQTLEFKKKSYFGSKNLHTTTIIFRNFFGKKPFLHYEIVDYIMSFV